MPFPFLVLSLRMSGFQGETSHVCAHLAKSALLIAISVVIVCGIYPGILWLVGQTLFPFQANGSIVRNADGAAIGSMLVAQPFTKDEYFQPRPSAASYDATASTSSGYAPSNYALRDRVARAIGPIATYASGDKKGQPVAPGHRGVVPGRQGGRQSAYRRAMGRRPQFASRRPGSRAIRPMRLTSTTGPRRTTASSRTGSRRIRRRPEPQATDLAVMFFETFSNEHPGMFPSSVTTTGADGKSTTAIEPVQFGLGHPVDILRHVAGRSSRRRAERRSGRPRHDVRLRPRPRHHPGERRVPARPRRSQMGRR